MLPGHSDDEKPHGANDGVVPKDVHPMPSMEELEGFGSHFSRLLHTEAVPDSRPNQFCAQSQDTCPDVKWSLRFYLLGRLLAGTDVPVFGNAGRAQAPRGLRFRSRYTPR